ncbi:hypothetical protein AX14_012860 [Amanita brunnescens Koide BX004]|nr:hypothetical protein AX14_012860 [Amanita brunnescens Koide BX004]
MAFVVVPDATIVLCHGFLGFEKVGPFKYFRGVEQGLKDIGCKVITPQVSKTGSIEERAKELNMEIIRLLKVTPGTIVNVHLMCHSMGGLDARRLVYLDEYNNGIKGCKYKVLSITTINTPHHGSPIAELLNTRSVVRLLSCQLLSIMGGSGKAAEDMRPRNMAKFNDIYGNKADIQYYSVMSKFEPWKNHLFFTTHKYIRNSEGRDYKDYPEAYGPNDGMVAVTSAKWGEFLDIIDSDTSHAGVIGWGSLGIAAGDSTYDTNKLYTTLVEHLAKNVECK